ncbi:retrovirus-related pol polyprotein from transposon TNT 1-94 [Tanacetum coccineum]
MLEKHMYDSWKSIMELYMQNREHGRMILESVEHGPLIWPTIEENGVTRTKIYKELSATEKIQADYDRKATNIILQGLPSDVYSLVNHHRVAKDLWERVQLLMQVMNVDKALQNHGSALSSIPDKDGMYIEVLERDEEVVRNTSRYEDIVWKRRLVACFIVKRVKLIVEMKLLGFSVGDHVMMNVLPWKGVVRFGKKGELAPRYIGPFEILERIGPVAYQLRLPDELSIGSYLSGGVTKLVRDLHTTNFDKLYAYLEQHELHANEVCIMRERNQDPLALVANLQMTPLQFNTYQSSYNYPQFQQQFSPSQFPTMITSSPYNITQLLIHPHLMQLLICQHLNQQTHLAEFPQIDSSLAVPVFKQGDDPIDAINKMMSFLSTVGRQSSFVAGTSRTRANISGIDGNNSGQQRVVKCFNCQWEGHMARQCPKPKRKIDATWFRDKVLLTKAVLMANLSSYESNVLSEVPHSEITHNNMPNQSVQEIPYSEQTHLVNYPENEITSDSNIIPYSQSKQVTNCNKVNKDNLIANKSLSAELEKYKERVRLLEERQNVDLSTKEKLIMDDIIWEKNA